MGFSRRNACFESIWGGGEKSQIIPSNFELWGRFFAKKCLKIFFFTNFEMKLGLVVFFTKRGTFGQQECKLWTTFRTNTSWLLTRVLGVHGEVDKYHLVELMQASVIPNVFARLPCSQAYPTRPRWLPLKHWTLYLEGNRNAERRKRQYPPDGALKRWKWVHINKSCWFRNISPLHRRNKERYLLAPVGGLSP